MWVADFTYVMTWSDVVYVAFVIDAFSRRIVGWKADTTIKTSLVLDGRVDDRPLQDRENQPARPLENALRRRDRNARMGRLVQPRAAALSLQQTATGRIRSPPPAEGDEPQLTASNEHGAIQL